MFLYAADVWYVVSPSGLAASMSERVEISLPVVSRSRNGSRS
jgi:hypothetical protein